MTATSITTIARQEIGGGYSMQQPTHRQAKKPKGETVARLREPHRRQAENPTAYAHDRLVAFVRLPS